MRTNWSGSIAVVYNSITGRAEWKKNWHGGVHGVFNPLTGIIEWQEAPFSGIYGVFNPRLNIVEWKKSTMVVYMEFIIHQQVLSNGEKICFMGMVVYIIL